MNHLKYEKSPYLLQHAENPVDWYPWGKEAFDKAKAEDRPVFLSIGYSTCHWCHVMAHESFEDDQVAEVLNNHYVCIKVDREERPDIDSVYMAACQAVTGAGGWPLTAILAPDQKPFFWELIFRHIRATGIRGSLKYCRKSAGSGEKTGSGFWRPGSRLQSLLQFQTARKGAPRTKGF